MDFLTFLSFKFAKFVSFSGVSGLTAVTVELAGSRYAGVLTFAPGVKWTVFSDGVRAQASETACAQLTLGCV